MCRDTTENYATRVLKDRKQTLREMWLTPITQTEAADTSSEVDTSLKLCDAVFCVTDCLTGEVCSFPACRAMIASTNRHFERLLFGEMTEAKTGKTIAINGVTIDGFKFLLALSYGFENELRLDEDNCVAVLQCADYFCDDDLYDACLQTIRHIFEVHGDMNTIFRIIKECKDMNIHEVDKVKKLIDDAFAIPRFVDNVLNSDALRHCTPERVLAIVCGDKNLACGEEQLWIKLVEWALYHYGNSGLQMCLAKIGACRDFAARMVQDDNQACLLTVVDHREIVAAERFGDYRDLLAPLLPFIRFPTMTAGFFSEHVVPLEILRADVTISLFSSFVGHPNAAYFSSQERFPTLMSKTDMRDLISKAFPSRQAQPNFRLLYRGSSNEFCASKLHEFCNTMGPTITVVETAYGHIIGGYSSSSWTSSQGWKKDTDSFLYISRVNEGVATRLGTLSLPIVLKSSDKINSQIYDSVGRGPCFSGLKIFDKCGTNEKSYCEPSSAYDFTCDGMPVYTSWFRGNPDTEDLNEKLHFRVKEYEVFAVE